jgi:hypothetical protein
MIETDAGQQVAQLHDSYMIMMMMMMMMMTELHISRYSDKAKGRTNKNSGFDSSYIEQQNSGARFFRFPLTRS